MAALKVATWNVESLFVPGSGDDQGAVEVFEKKLEVLSRSIEHLDPDIVAFQEVGEGALEQLRERLGPWEHLRVSGFGDQRGIRVGFLSKLAIEAHEDIVDFPEGPALSVSHEGASGEVEPSTRLGRGALRVVVSKGGRRFELVTCHLKSKLLTYPRPGGSAFFPRDERERAMVGGYAIHQRTAEAVALRLRANELLREEPARALILLGDLNDGPEAQTTQLLYGPSGSQPLTGGFDKADKGDRFRLFNTSYFIPEVDRYSRLFSGEKEMLDQILVSEELLPPGPGGARTPPEEVAAHHDLPDQVLESINDDPSLRAKKVWPDHAPVTATFEL